MFWNYLSLLLITALVSQAIKLLLKPRASRSSFKEIKNTLLFYSGPPSSHSAVLVMTLLYLKDKASIDQPIFIVFLVMSIYWLYEIFMQRKRFDALIKLLGMKKKDVAVLKNRELHGHDLMDIVSGIVLGAVIYWLITSLAPATFATSPLVDLAWTA